MRTRVNNYCDALIYKIAIYRYCDMAEGRTDEIADANEEWNDLLEQQTEIEALQGQCRGNLCFISSSCSRV